MRVERVVPPEECPPIAIEVLCVCEDGHCDGVKTFVLVLTVELSVVACPCPRQWKLAYLEENSQVRTQQFQVNDHVIVCVVYSAKRPKAKKFLSRVNFHLVHTCVYARHVCCYSQAECDHSKCLSNENHKLK